MLDVILGFATGKGVLDDILGFATGKGVLDVILGFATGKGHFSKGGRGFMMSPPPPTLPTTRCVESQGCQFDPTFLYLLFCSSAYIYIYIYIVLLLFLSYHFLLLAHSPDFIPPKPPFS